MKMMPRIHSRQLAPIVKGNSGVDLGMGKNILSRYHGERNKIPLNLDITP